MDRTYIILDKCRSSILVDLYNKPRLFVVVYICMYFAILSQKFPVLGRKCKLKGNLGIMMTIQILSRETDEFS